MPPARHQNLESIVRYAVTIEKIRYIEFSDFVDFPNESRITRMEAKCLMPFARLLSPVSVKSSALGKIIEMGCRRVSYTPHQT